MYLNLEAAYKIDCTSITKSLGNTVAEMCGVKRISISPQSHTTGRITPRIV
jgi:hypothetical protein